MGQKANPNGFRLGVNHDWEAKWYADKNYTNTLNENLHTRKFTSEGLADAFVSTTGAGRVANRVSISIHIIKPSMVIDKGDKEVEALRKQLSALAKKDAHINAVEIREPDLDAKLVGEGIARQPEARTASRHATRQVTQRSMHSDTKGIKVQTVGRLNGADATRKEWYTEGGIPLHTLRADIDYAWVEATTTHGQTGVKIWVNRGEILLQRKNKPSKKTRRGN